MDFAASSILSDKTAPIFVIIASMPIRFLQLADKIRVLILSKFIYIK